MSADDQPQPDSDGGSRANDALLAAGVVGAIIGGLVIAPEFAALVAIAAAVWVVATGRLKL